MIIIQFTIVFLYGDLGKDIKISIKAYYKYIINFYPGNLFYKYGIYIILAITE